MPDFINVLLLFPKYQQKVTSERAYIIAHVVFLQQLGQGGTPHLKLLFASHEWTMGAEPVVLIHDETMIQMGPRPDYTSSPNTLASHFHTLVFSDALPIALVAQGFVHTWFGGETSPSSCLPAWPGESKKEAGSRDPTPKHLQIFWLHMDKTLLTGWNDAWISLAIARAWTQFSHISNLWVRITTRGEKTKHSPFALSSPINRQACIPSALHVFSFFT